MSAATFNHTMQFVILGMMFFFISMGSLFLYFAMNKFEFFFKEIVGAINSVSKAVTDAEIGHLKRHNEIKERADQIDRRIDALWEDRKAH